jgi:hypothetical protein
MKAKNFKPFNMRTHESLREETCDDTTGVVARWQTRLEVRPRLRPLQVAFGVRTFGATSNY